MSIEIGKLAPEFELLDENGIKRALADYRGTYVVLYFYPKDETPGCTTEACNFRDNYQDYLSKGAVILGVSADSVKSHVKFKTKHHLQFPLLADTDHSVCELYGAWGKKKMMGHEFEGIKRTTFLIDPEGIVKQIFEKVNPTVHSQEVLGAICA
jgi:thioredoxin-dependent peroxiredoxin